MKKKVFRPFVVGMLFGIMANVVNPEWLKVLNGVIGLLWMTYALLHSVYNLIEKKTPVKSVTN